MAGLGPNEPLESIAREYSSDRRIAHKMQELKKQGYVGWRRTGSDGNTFYRAVAFGVLEKMVLSRDRRTREQQADLLLERLRAIRFKDRHEVDAHEGLLARIQRLRMGGGWEEPSERDDVGTTAVGLLFRSIRDPRGTVDMALIRALRRLAMRFLIDNANDARANQGVTFQSDCKSRGYTGGVQEYCVHEILHLGVEAEGVALQALSAALGITLCVTALASAELEFRDLGCGGALCVHLLWDGRNYQLLYMPEERRHPITPSLGDADQFPTYSPQAYANLHAKFPTLGVETFGECDAL